MTTPLLQNPTLYDNLSQSYTAVNAALLRLEAFSYRVLSATTYAAPTAPSNGDAYLIPSAIAGDALTGVWAYYPANSIVAFIDNVWEALTPFEGLILFVVDQEKPLVFINGAWRDLIGAGAGSDTAIIVEAMLDIPLGYPVSIYDFDMVNYRCQVIPYDPDISPALGVSADLMYANQTGRVLLSGTIDGVNLTAFTQGATLYATPTGLSSTRPTTGYRQPLARVISDSQMAVHVGYPEPSAAEIAYATTTVAGALDELYAADVTHLLTVDPHGIADLPRTKSAQIMSTTV